MAEAHPFCSYPLEKGLPSIRFRQTVLFFSGKNRRMRFLSFYTITAGMIFSSLRPPKQTFFHAMAGMKRKSRCKSELLRKADWDDVK
jgi:hypothetical protein